jgi:hypothetical protein
MRDWDRHTAQSRFEELFKCALSEGPQRVRAGSEAVVILSSEEFERLSTAERARDLVAFFADSPLTKENLDLERAPDLGRTLDWEEE